MSAPVDISAEALEAMMLHFGNLPNPDAAIAKVRALRDALEATERERDGALALVERMHAQDVLAIKQWQEANPGNDLVWPDNMRLTAWCMGEVAKLSAFRGQISDVLAENDALRFTLNNAQLSDATGYARGVRDGIRKAAALFNVNDWPAYGYLVQHTILALLPATDATKETQP